MTACVPCGRRPDCVASPLDTWAGTFKGCCGQLEPAFFQTALGHGRTLPRWTFPSGGESGPTWGGWRGCAWRAAVGGVDHPPPHTYMPGPEALLHSWANAGSSQPPAGRR